MSYGELNRLANVVARHLIDRGIGPEAVVGLLLESWPLRLVGLLGVLKAGAAYLPLDPEHPDERLATTFRDSGAAVLLAEEALRDRLPAFEPGADRLPRCAARFELRATTRGIPASRWTATTWPTSSSPRGPRAGPKGVMVHHRALLAVASAWERLYDLRGATRRHLQAAPFAFDVFTGDWVRALTTGGTLVACPRHVLLDPPALAELIEAERVDAVELVPAIAEALAEPSRPTPAPPPCPCGCWRSAPTRCGPGCSGACAASCRPAPGWSTPTA